MSDQTASLPVTNSLFARALWQSRVLVTLTLGFTAFAYAVSHAIGQPFENATSSQLGTFAKTLTPAFLVLLMILRFLHLAIFVRPKNPTQRFLQDVRYYCLDLERVLTGLVTFIAVTAITGSFIALKDFIPLINPFSWDPTFAHIDRVLHGGYNPYEWLLPFTSSPLVTTALNAAYHFWFFLLFFVVYMVCLDRDNVVRRNTFLIAFGLTWIVSGTLLATAFASVGPVYYEAFGYGDDFVPLMELLKANAEVSPVWALGVQDMLLQGYQTGEGPRGISAMPSMHVTSSALLAIYGFAWRRWAGWALTAFAVIIQIGSVHLGWHYAIDGYFGTLIALGCWYCAKWLAQRYS